MKFKVGDVIVEESSGIQGTIVDISPFVSHSVSDPLCYVEDGRGVVHVFWKSECTLMSSNTQAKKMICYKVGDELTDATGREFVVTHIASLFMALSPYQLTELTADSRTIIKLSKDELDKFYTVKASVSTDVTFLLRDPVIVTGGLYAGAAGIIKQIDYQPTHSIFYVDIPHGGTIQCLQCELVLLSPSASIIATQTLATPTKANSTPASTTANITPPAPVGAFNAGGFVCFTTVPTEIYEVMSKGLVSNSNKLGYWIAKPTTPAVVVWAEESELTAVGGLAAWLPPNVTQSLYENVDLSFLDGLKMTSTLGAHETHEVITNEVLGKKFKYCRDCKTEV